MSNSKMRQANGKFETSLFPTHNKGQVPFTKKCVFDVATPSFLGKDLNFRNFFVTPLVYF